MDKALYEQLDQLGSAFDALIESISANNPSVAAADRLLAADDTFSEGLKKLAMHQLYYERIQALNNEADSLNAQIKDKLRALDGCRKELTAIPSASIPASATEASITDILSMGQRISKFTIPPAFRPPSAAEAPAKADVDVEMNNGIATPPATTSPLHPLSKTQTEKVKIIAQLDSETRDILAQTDPSKQLWQNHPSDNAIRSGVMMDLQAMLDQGIDPACIGVQQPVESDQWGPTDSSAEWERKRKADEEQRDREAIVAARAEGRTIPVVQQPQIPHGMDIFDDDDDDE